MSYRNTMYTMLTRSFIRSYLMLPKGEGYDNGFTREMYEGGQAIMKEKKLVVTAPTEKEQVRIKAWVNKLCLWRIGLVIYLRNWILLILIRKILSGNH